MPAMTLQEKEGDGEGLGKLLWMREIRFLTHGAGHCSLKLLVFRCK